ncbi:MULTISPECIES: Fic family protein [Gordonibacter]|uniref:Fic family protein n=1 Tax=Gordonibacter faecis TaxID=3047475 RepID=A0ABT7DJC2_9ACTN|nr:MULTISPECIES: Fic family protein [unclassified Gordonibacter]MDJ1649617.1 Fic family protein [Gordonibacter sp. KGMB12511]
MGYEPPFKRTARIDSLAMEVAEMVGALPASGLVSNLHLHRELRIRTIRSSLMIEGNTLSENTVTAIIDGKKVLGDADDIREVENAKRAYDLMNELDPFSLDDLLRAHRVMMDGLVKEAGSFRSKNAGVFDGDRLIHAGTPANYVPEVMKDLFGWMNKTDLHPLLMSCVFHYEFEFVHPFLDGNGRTGRLWHTLLLAHWRPALAWLPVESVILERQQGYYAALAKSNEEGTCETFVEFMLEVIRDALAPYAGRASEADLREEKVLDLLRNNPHMTVAGIAEATGIPQRTIERTIANLRKSGRLVREGSTRAGVWKVEGY